jgi:hypothetical protein
MLNLIYYWCLIEWRQRHEEIVIKRPVKKHNLCLDKGYDYPEIERESIKRRYVPHIRHRGEEFIKLRYSARRWVIERYSKLIIGRSIE